MVRKESRKGRSVKTLDEREREEEEREVETNGGSFFACYLLSSQSPRHKGHTYIGFTVNPRRRIRQHNGEIRCGAWRTKRARPWEMVLCIYGFQSNVSALQFEWAWQHPTESLAVRKAASHFKSLSGVANKIKIAYAMLNLPSWENLNLTVNFFSTKYMKHLGGCPRLPKQMKVNVCIMDDLPCYVEGQILDCNDYDSDKINYEQEKISEDINLANGIEGDAHSFERRSSSDFSKYIESNNCRYEFADSPKPGEIYERISTSLCRIPQSLNKTLNDDLQLSLGFISSSREEHSFEWLEESNLQRQPSFLRSSKNDVSTDSLLISPVPETKPQKYCSDESNAINLSTPTSCIVGKRNKRAKVYSEVIDLTNSPIIIQL